MRLRGAALPAGVGALATIVSATGSWIPSYWGDEAASVMSAERSWSSLATMLTTIDAVHGLYYALLHLWIDVAGSSEFATRLPSALAVGLMVAGVVVLARRFSPPRFALLAGLVAAVVPRTTAMGIEARSTALAAAAAVWLTVLLVHLIETRASRAAWVAYGVGVAAGTTLFLYLALLVPVHGLALLLLARRPGRMPGVPWRRWALGAAVAAGLATPILVAAFLQREQIAFLGRRDYTNPGNVLINQWFGDPGTGILAWGLVLVALGWWVAVLVRRRRVPPGIHDLAALTLPWFAAPTLLLLLGHLVTPLYNVRYLAFCVPAVAIVVAAGITVIARGVGMTWSRRRRSPGIRRRTLVAAAAAFVVFAAVAAPGYLTQRGPFAKDGGSDLRQVAEYLGAHAREGEAVVFDGTQQPFRNPRLSLNLYPEGFVKLSDVQLVTRYDETDGLWDRVASVPDLAPLVAEYDGVWAVELPHGDLQPYDVTTLISLGYSLDSIVLINRTTVFHLSKG